MGFIRNVLKYSTSLLDGNLNFYKRLLIRGAYLLLEARKEKAFPITETLTKYSFFGEYSLFIQMRSFVCFQRRIGHKIVLLKWKLFHFSKS